MATIRVIPVGHLGQYVEQETPLDIAGWAGRPVRELIEELGIPSMIVSAVLVRGRLVLKDYVLQDGDEIKLIPLLGGG